MGLDIPRLVTHVARDGEVLFRGAVATADATPEAATALAHLEAYTSFVHSRVPEALDQVRSGLALIVDERLVDDAVGNPAAVTLGRAGAKFASEPINSPIIVGHELTHSLDLGDGNYMVEELAADWVGLAYARATGAAPSAGADAWKLGMVDRDLRRPALATLDELKQYGSLDTHVMAGPLGAAMARVSDELGVSAVDAITTETVLRELPRSSASVKARIDDLIWSERSHDEIQRAISDISMEDGAQALLAVAARQHGRSSSAVDVIRRELGSAGVSLR